MKPGDGYPFSDKIVVSNAPVLWLKGEAIQIPFTELVRHFGYAGIAFAIVGLLELENGDC
jgi:hypothetical protein